MTVEINTKNHISPVALVAVGEPKNDSKQLLALISSLQNSMEMVTSQASDQIATVNNANGQTYEQAMVAMAHMLAELQIIVTQLTKDKSDYDTEIAKTQLKILTTAYNDLETKMKSADGLGDKASTLSTVLKVITIAIAVVVSVAALACGQVEIAALVMGLTIMQTSGLFDVAANGLSSLLQDMGMSQEAANIVAKVIIMVVVVILTAAVAPEDAVSEVAEVAPELAEGGSAAATTSEEASTAATNAEEVAQNSSVLTDVKSFLNKINLFNRLSTRANLCINSGVQTAMGTNLTQDLVNQMVDAIAKLSPMSEEKKKELEMILNLVATILLVIVQMASGSAMVGSETAVSETSIFSKIKNFLQDNRSVMKGLDNAKFMLNAASAGVSIAKGSVEINQGIIQAEMADDKYIIAIAQMLISMINKRMEATEKSEADSQAAYAQETHSLSQISAGERAVSDLLQG